MRADDVLFKFKGWHLVTALAEAPRAVALLWNSPVVHLIPSRGEAPGALSAILELPSVPDFVPQPTFQRGDAMHFGFEDQGDYEQNFWGLRPDFKMQAANALVLLEAKGGSAPRKTWTARDAKESLYYRFLHKAQIEKKGLVYIVPRAAERDCSSYLGQYFQSDPVISVGYVFWEDLLPAMASELLQVAVDEVVSVTDGLRLLRQWQREISGPRSDVV